MIEYIFLVIFFIIAIIEGFGEHKDNKKKHGARTSKHCNYSKRKETLTKNMSDAFFHQDIQLHTEPLFMVGQYEGYGLTNMPQRTTVVAKKRADACKGESQKERTKRNEHY